MHRQLRGTPDHEAQHEHEHAAHDEARSAVEHALFAKDGVRVHGHDADGVEERQQVVEVGMRKEIVMQWRREREPNVGHRERWRGVIHR